MPSCDQTKYGAAEVPNSPYIKLSGTVNLLRAQAVGVGSGKRLD